MIIFKTRLLKSYQMFPNYHLRKIHMSNNQFWRKIILIIFTPSGQICKPNLYLWMQRDKKSNDWGIISTQLTNSIHHSQAHHISVSMLLYSGFTFLDKQKMAKSGPKTRFVLTPLCVTSIQTWPPIRPAGAQWEISPIFYSPSFQNY